MVRLLGREDTENARHTVRTCLGLLMQQGYVKPRRFHQRHDNPYTRSHAYYLTKKGIVLTEHAGRAFSSTYIERHDLEISTFHIEAGIMARSHNLVLDWMQPKLDFKRLLNPDAYFGLANPSLIPGQNTFHYFLEIERSKIGNYGDGKPSIIRKLQ